MRGKVKSLEGFMGNDRITPAYAGKRMRVCLVGAAIRDHPRLCGEKLLIVQLQATALGSPPPMRGKANIGDDIGDDFRITPAYAGKRFEIGSGSAPS